MLNSCNLMGRISTPLELKSTQTGANFIRFDIAVDRDYKDSATGERKTDFFHCVAWGKTAEFISEYFEKGMPVGLSASLTTDKYTDKDGIVRTWTELRINRIYHAGGKPASADTSKAVEQPVSTPPSVAQEAVAPVQPVIAETPANAPADGGGSDDDDNASLELELTPKAPALDVSETEYKPREFVYELDDPYYKDPFNRGTTESLR